jgi:L-ascorbate metabolism protein UlaG (beta-lactamase superfamily)
MKKLKRIMIITLSILLLFAIAVFAFVQQPKFGKLPSGERLERIKKSPNYRNGEFQNQNPTPVMAEDANYFSTIKEFFTAKDKRPTGEIPSTKTDLSNLDPSEDVLVWFGHSSYYMQLDGKKILVDPVLSGAASPLAFTMQAFKGTDPYAADDIPEIDYLFITHDHWDHLDYKTVLALKPKIKKIICGLGVGEHFEYWGFDANKIIEMDWNKEILLDSSLKVHSIPARHFSGRRSQANATLWTAFALQTPSLKIFIGGDGGYDNHFAEAGKTLGGFDVAILENGQYNKSWPNIHLMPEEAIQATKDLKAKRLFPVHSSKFALANHSWDDPLKRITELSDPLSPGLITPMIGEKVFLADRKQKFTYWWEGLK